MQEVLQFLVNGLAIGGTYALVTLGLALLFSVMRLINFAYGVLITAGGYIMYLTAGVPWIGQAVLVIAGTALLSVLMERVAFGPIRDADGNTLLITSFAISYLVQNILFTTVGSRPRALAMPDFLTGSVSVLGVSINKADLATILAAGVALAVVTVVIQKTVLGLRIRAVAEDSTMTQLLGIRPGPVLMLAFALSGALAGVASLFYLAKGALVTPTIGNDLILIAFVAVVVGGMGSLVGAALGGLLLGMISGALQTLLPGQIVQFRDAFLFVLVIVVLLIRPQGLIAVRGNKERV